MGYTLEQLQAMGATPHDESAPDTPTKGYTLDELKALGATPHEESPGSIQSFAEHAADKSIAGYYPQVVGGANKLAGNDYLPARDKTVARLGQEWDEHPIASGAGNLVGYGANAIGLGKLIGPLSAAAKGLSTAGKMGLGALQGAFTGAVQNPGDKAGIVDTTQVGDRAINAGLGGLIGGALPGVPAAAKKLGSMASTGVTKAGSTLTGIPEAEMGAYVRENPAVKKLMSAGSNAQEIVDNARNKINGWVATTKNDLGNRLNAGLDNGVESSLAPYIAELEAHKANLNPALSSHRASISKIDQMISDAKQLGGITPKVASADSASVQPISKNFQEAPIVPPSPTEPVASLSKIQQLKQEAQKISQGEWPDGTTMPKHDPAKQAAKSGKYVANQIINEGADPDVAAVNKEYVKLHNADANMNKNVLKVGGPTNSLVSAGNNTNPRFSNALKILDNATGEDVSGEATRAASAARFKDAPWLPVDATGKSVARQGLAGLIGSLMGKTVGKAAKYTLGAPAVWKKSIDIGLPIAQGGSDAAQAISQFASDPKNLSTILQMLNDAKK